MLVFWKVDVRTGTNTCVWFHQYYYMVWLDVKHDFKYAESALESIFIHINHIISDRLELTFSFTSRDVLTKVRLLSQVLPYRNVHIFSKHPIHEVMEFGSKKG